MEFEYIYDNDSHLVKIEPGRSGEHKAVIGEEEYRFSVSNTSPNEFSVLSGNKNIKVYVAESDDYIFVSVAGKVVQLNKPNASSGGISGPGTEFGSKDEVTTPMPGKVVKILAGKGDLVTAGQPLVIVESMKMENEIKSPADGEVVSVNNSEGDLVEPGQVIIKLNPKE